MINNFDTFPFEFMDWEFYFFQIIKRKKDNPDTAWINWNNHARCIKTYSIYTKEQLDKRKQEIIDICTVTNSRLYMHPARRSKDKVRLEMLSLITENIVSNKHTLDWLYNTACWQKTYSQSLWVVDIDDWWPTVDMVELTVNSIRPFNTVQFRIKTKNWRHLITKPFDLNEFKNNHPDIDVHKNNPTIIFIP